MTKKAGGFLPNMQFDNTLWRLSAWTGVAVYVALIWQYISVWTTPGPMDGPKILTLTNMVIFEFVLAHSGVFMAVFPRRIALMIFVPFYGVFALIFNAITPGNTILFLYGSVILMRMRFMFSDPESDARTQAVIMSFLSLFIFMFALIGSSAAAGFLPKIGLTTAYLESINFWSLTTSSGDFIDSPHAGIAAGIIYFSLLALTEIWIGGLLKRPNARN